MLVVVEDGDVQLPRESRLYVEAARRRDVLEVDAAERRREVLHALDDGVGVLRGQTHGHSVDAGELGEDRGLALHDRQRRTRADIAEAEHRRAVGHDGDRVLLAGEFTHLGGVVRDRHGRLADAGGVDDAQVLCVEGHLGGDDDLAP